MLIWSLNVTAQTNCYCRFWAFYFEFSFKTFKGISFSSPKILTIYPPLGPASFLQSNRCGTPTKSTPFRANVLTGTSPRVYPRGPASSLALVLSFNRCGTLQNPLPSDPASSLAHCLVSTLGAQHPRWHLFLSPIDVGPLQNPLPSEPASLLAHRLVSIPFGEEPPPVYPLRRTASSLAHSLVSGSDPICNSSSSRLPNTILFGLSLSGFPSRFLKRVCQGEVSTPL